MRKEAQLFKSLADETRLKMLWLLMGREELCVCDIMGVLGTTQSKASRHLRYLYHLGWVTDRRDGVWMNYRLSVVPGSPEDKQLKLLADILSSQPGGPGLTRPVGAMAGGQRTGQGRRRRVSMLLSLFSRSFLNQFFILTYPVIRL